MELRRKHGSYDSMTDKEWHTIGEMDMMVEKIILDEGQSKKL